MADMLDQLNLGDLEYLEAQGVDIDTLAEWEEGVMPKASHIIQIAYIIQRKTDPDLDLDQVRAIPLAQLKSLLAGIGGDESDPQ